MKGCPSTSSMLVRLIRPMKPEITIASVIAGMMR